MSARYRTERDRCADHADGFATHPDQCVITASQEPAQRLVPLLGQQVDLDGQLHDLSPQTRQERLFAPDVQLAGQTYMDTTNESETDHAH